MPRTGEFRPHPVRTATLHTKTDGRAFLRVDTRRNRLNDIPVARAETGKRRPRLRNIRSGDGRRHIAPPRIRDQTIPFVQAALLAEPFAADADRIRTGRRRDVRASRTPQCDRKDRNQNDISEQTFHSRFRGDTLPHNANIMPFSTRSRTGPKPAPPTRLPDRDPTRHPKTGKPVRKRLRPRDMPAPQKARRRNRTQDRPSFLFRKILRSGWHDVCTTLSRRNDGRR